jgi:hypothetical protein
MEPTPEQTKKLRRWSATLCSLIYDHVTSQGLTHNGINLNINECECKNYLSILGRRADQAAPSPELIAALNVVAREAKLIFLDGSHTCPVCGKVVGIPLNFRASMKLGNDGSVVDFDFKKLSS